MCIGISLDRREAYVVRAYECVNGSHVTKHAICKRGEDEAKAKTGEITHYENEGVRWCRYGI